MYKHVPFSSVLKDPNDNENIYFVSGYCSASNEEV